MKSSGPDTQVALILSLIHILYSQCLAIKNVDSMMGRNLAHEAGTTMLTPVTVSYTHLDVYKRQNLCKLIVPLISTFANPDFIVTAAAV